MVTCQSANQLKTPAKQVSWAFKMVSQFGSLGYTIMGKTADLTVVQKTIIDTLHKEGVTVHTTGGTRNTETRSKLKIIVFNDDKAGQDKARQTHRNTGE